MAETKHFGALAAAAGTLVAGGVLLLTLLVGVEPAGAAFPGQNGEIVFASKHYPGGVDGEIYTINSNGTGDPVRLTNNTVKDSYPAWSPDAPLPGGNQIAFSSDRDGNPGDIYTMNPSLVTELGPNGLIINLTTDRLTNSSAWDVWPAWSPDGNKIAFVSNREDHQEIYTMNSNGSGEAPLNNGIDVQGVEPDWQPLRQTPVLPHRQLQP